jgi:predicted metal-binding protein
MFIKHGFSDYKWIDPKNFVISQWVRMKCMYGCGKFGKGAVCPPNIPSVKECEKFFSEFKEGVVFHLTKEEDTSDNRIEWYKDVNSRLIQLERDVFLSGYVKAFVLYANPCRICDDCVGTKADCKHPRLSRPTPEAMAMDVYTTVRNVGYPIQVLKNKSETMNRYAFLLIE